MAKGRLEISSHLLDMDNQRKHIVDEVTQSMLRICAWWTSGNAVADQLAESLEVP